jgi:hypothetical protein
VGTGGDHTAASVGIDTYDGQGNVSRTLVLNESGGLEIGESNLHLLDPRGFTADKIGQVTVEANGKSKTVARMTTKGGADGSQNVKTWGDPATGKADQTAANFVDNANNLRPTEYAANLKATDLQLVLKLSYKEERGAPLGTLARYKREKPGQLAEGQELDPANPPKGDTEYYIITEKTRVPALVRKDTAQRMEQDIETVFSGKAPEPTSVEPKGNPFGNGPMPPTGPTPPGANPHGGMPGGPTPPPGMAPTGAPMAPGAGSAANPSIPGTAPTPGPKPTTGPTPSPAGTNPTTTPSPTTAPVPATKPTPAPPAAPAAGSAAAPKPPATPCWP